MSIEVLDHGAPFHRDGSSLVPRTHRIYIPIDGTFPALQVCAMADKASQGANVISMGDKLISMGDKDCVVLPEVLEAKCSPIVKGYKSASFESVQGDVSRQSVRGVVSRQSVQGVVPRQSVRCVVSRQSVQGVMSRQSVRCVVSVLG
eukprot:gene26236-17334_t